MYKVKVGEGLSFDKLRINVDNANLKITSQRKRRESQAFFKNYLPGYI